VRRGHCEACEDDRAKHNANARFHEIPSLDEFIVFGRLSFMRQYRQHVGTGMRGHALVLMVRESEESSQEAAMTYRVYSGPRGAQAVSPIEKDRMLFKEFSSLDEAMSWAGHVNRSGLTTLLIEGDDGTHLGKQEVVAALRHRETERPQAGRSA